MGTKNWEKADFSEPDRQKSDPPYSQLHSLTRFRTETTKTIAKRNRFFVLDLTIFINSRGVFPTAQPDRRLFVFQLFAERQSPQPQFHHSSASVNAHLHM